MNFITTVVFPRHSATYSCGILCRRKHPYAIFERKARFAVRRVKVAVPGQKKRVNDNQVKGVKVMKLRLIATIVTGAAAPTLWSAAFGQANPQNSGYVLFGYGTPDKNIWRSGSYGGKPGINDTLCWRTGYWTPAMAIVECDPDLVPKPPAPPPAAPPAPPPPPPP